MSSKPTPPSGFVHLILLSREGEDRFYLEIPIFIATTVCLSPRKYLRYLGWCVLGVVGTLADEEGDEISLAGELLDQGIYRYLELTDNDDPFAYAVDLEVIKQRSQVPSETTRTREDFRAKLLARDGICVWSGMDGMGMHIIPHSRGDEWLQLIVANRPHHEDKEMESLSINDIRNGIYAEDYLHNHHFDPREVVVLKTPNPILETTDIPDRYQRHMPTDVSYPYNSRYTLQWIVIPRELILKWIPNNNDATFMNQSLPKPADILLHYNYGAAVVKQWGKNTGVLTNRPNIPRPSIPSLAPKGLRGIHDSTSALDKRATTGADNEKNTGGEAADSEAQGSWDEDDVMLFFWGNSRAAQERHAQKEQERNENLEKWRTAVTGDVQYRDCGPQFRIRSTIADVLHKFDVS